MFLFLSIAIFPAIGCSNTNSSTLDGSTQCPEGYQYQVLNENQINITVQSPLIITSGADTFINAINSCSQGFQPTGPTVPICVPTSNNLTPIPYSPACPENYIIASSATATGVEFAAPLIVEVGIGNLSPYLGGEGCPSFPTCMPDPYARPLEPGVSE